MSPSDTRRAVAAKIQCYLDSKPALPVSVKLSMDISPARRSELLA